MATALQIDTNLTYCPTSLIVSQPLTITNISDEELVFKIKTNKKNYLSMNPSNGTIKPYSNLAIPIKIAEHVPENVSIKLEVDWCKFTPEMKEKNDIKMTTVNDKDIFKKVFPIIRKESQSTSTNINLPEPTTSLTTSTFSDVIKIQKEESKITPFEVEKKQPEEKPIQSPSRSQSPKKMFSSFKEEPLKQENEFSDNIQQYRSANQILDALSSPNRNLQIVSEEDEEDHQKELEQIRNEQLNQRRLIDELESKIRKFNKQVKSTEIIDLKILSIAMAASFLAGGILQYLIF